MTRTTTSCHCGRCASCDNYYRLGLYLERVKNPLAFGEIERDIPVADLAVGQEFRWWGVEGTVVGRSGSRNAATARTVCVMDPGIEVHIPNRTMVTALARFSKVFHLPKQFDVPDIWRAK